MNLRKPPDMKRNRSMDAKKNDLTSLVSEAKETPGVAARGVQGVHAEVMRRLMSEGSKDLPEFHEVRAIVERNLV